MATLHLHETGQPVEIAPDDLVRLAKVHEDSSDGDPTLVVAETGRFVVEESIRTICARFGSASPTSDFHDPETDRPGAFSLLKVAALTKVNQETGDEDPTSVHLSNGETIVTTDSIRTLGARLKLDAGVSTMPIDIVEDGRPAEVVVGHVLRVMHFSDYPREDPIRCVVVVSGHKGFACRDEPARLHAFIEAVAPTSAAARPAVLLDNPERMSPQPA